jgi:hypothetical protein
MSEKEKELDPENQTNFLAMVHAARAAQENTWKSMKPPGDCNGKAGESGS